VGSRFGRAALVLFAAMAPACSENRSIPAPPEAGQSAIFVHYRDAIILEAHALEGGDPLPPLVLDAELDNTYYYAVYDRTLAAQRIVAGPITLTAEGREPNDPARGFSLIVGINEWEPAIEPPSAWDTLRVQGVPIDCGQFGNFARTEVTITQSATTGRSWGSSAFGRNYVGNDAGLWEVVGETVEPMIVGSEAGRLGLTGTSTRPIVAMFNGLARGVYLYQRGGLVWRGDFDASFSVLGAPPGAGTAETAWIVGTPFQGYEVFILDSKGGLWRYLDDDNLPIADRWTTLLEPGEEDFGWRGGLVFVAEGDIYVIGPEGGKIMRFTDGERRARPTPEPSHPTALVSTMLMGVLMGDEEGRLWRDINGNWQKLEAQVMPPVVMIAPFFDGVLYGGKDGVLSYYRANAPECTMGVVTSPTTFGLRPTREGYQLFSSSGFFGDAGTITLTTIRP
jgi:hypothetical protein